MPARDGAASVSKTVNSASATPGRALRTANLRVQLAESLRERLQMGEWHEGDQLPTEAELASEYGVSRSTVRSALQQLETLGLTITRHGKIGRASCRERARITARPVG